MLILNDFKKVQISKIHIISKIVITSNTFTPFRRSVFDKRPKGLLVDHKMQNNPYSTFFYNHTSKHTVTKIRK